MKAISIRQPWANLIASGDKTIETRVWGTPYRGRVLLVSSKTPKIPPAGFALAVADLVDCRPMTKLDERAAKCEIYPEAIAWVLANVQAIVPFPVKGQLGLYEVNVDLAALVPTRVATQSFLFSR